VTAARMASGVDSMRNNLAGVARAESDERPGPELPDPGRRLPDMRFESEEQCRRIVEQAPFAIAIFDEQLRYAMVSPTWLETFKGQGNPQIGLSLDEIAPGVYDAVVAVQRRALAGVTTTADGDRVVDSRGEERWLRWEVRPWRDAAEAIVGVIVYVNDVSALSQARREAERLAHRLKIALRAANAAVIEVDYDLGVHWTSEEFTKVIGRTISFDEASQTVWPFIHPEDAPIVQTALGAWLDGGPVEPLEVRIVRPLGDARWVRIYTEIEKDTDGRRLGAVSLLMDIDEAKRQELALIAAERAAHAGLEAKAQFLANMSHEIRTPMNGVLGILHLLKGQPLPGSAQSLVAEALACGDMLRALLDDVVDISKIDAGKVEVEAQPTDPAALLTSVVEMLRPQAEAKGLGFSLEAEPLSPWILTDPTRLRQCLFNLIGNAVKFTETGAVTVRASMRGAASGPRLRFTVTDTGIGISSAAQERLFERFQQADATTTRRFGGSGLGLAITRDLAMRMGGEVGLISALGEGSTFWIEVAAPPAAAPTEVETGAEPVLDGVRVLVVEDNATNRMIVAAMLETLGASVCLAEDGERGVEAALSGGFDLILMDIQMPGIDGLEATRRIRAAGGALATTPIVALTANVMSDQRQTYLDAGMNGVIAKPISPAALISEIAQLAER
jgi:PAS domain S-box-containing protein